MLEQLMEGGDFDRAIHFVTVAFSLVLFLVSCRYYAMNRKRKFLYVTLAFLLFSVAEVLVLANILLLKNSLVTSASHFVIFFVLALFFMGTVRK